MVAILAANHAQYIRWMRRNLFTRVETGESTDYKYIRDVDSLRGIELSGYIIVEDFWNREDAQAIHIMAIDRVRTTERI